jgi:predicted flap endonuclease-1-like 5' DNA nuclease
MANIEEIEGIGEVYGAKLAEAGVKTAEALLAAAGGKKGREELAAKTGISEALLLEWVNRADLMRVKGVGSEYADLLEAAGVDSPAELAQRNAANLTAKMAEINEAKNLVRRVPTESEVEGWIESAKTLDKVVTH